MLNANLAIVKRTAKPADDEPTALSEAHRQKLDGIVRSMVANGESDDNIRLVVADFKQKYGGVVRPLRASPPKASTEDPLGFLGGFNPKAKGAPAKSPAPYAMDREATRQKVFQKIHPGQDVVPLSEQGKAKKPATMANMLSDINESAELLGKNIRDVPGMAHVDALVKAQHPSLPVPNVSDVVAGTIMGPLNTATDVANFLSTGELEALANVVRDMGLPPGILKAGGAVLKKAAALLKGGKRAEAEKLLKNLAPTRPADKKVQPQAAPNPPQFEIPKPSAVLPNAEMRKVVEQALKDGKTVPPQVLADSPDLKPPVAPKVGTATDDAFGLATRFEQEGKPFASQKHGVRVEELAEAGKKALDSQEVSLPQVYDKATRQAGISPVEGAAAAYRGKQIENRVSAILKQMDGEIDEGTAKSLLSEMDELDQEMTNILGVGNELQRTFHQTGQTLQAAFKANYSRAHLGARAKAANFGNPLEDAQRAHFEKAISDLETTNAGLQAAKTELEERIARMKQGGGMRSADTTVRKKALVDGILQDLGMGKKAGTDPGPARSKQSGALNIPRGQEARLNAKVTQLAKMYLDAGAKNLDEVVGQMVKDIPLLKEDDVLSLLSGKYKARLLKADVHKLDLNSQLRAIRDRAEFKQKNIWQKSLAVSSDALLSSQRALQTGVDLSASFIQGLPGAIVSPSNWAKSFVQQYQPLVHGTTGARYMQAKIERDPAFAYAKKAQVRFTDASGPGSAQEEIFRGNLIEALRNVKLPIQKIRGVGVPGATTYAEVIGRSNEAFTTMTNHLRMGLFKKLVAGQWRNPDALRDAARLTNILTGRGDGKMADALSAKGFAYIGYAPRFMYSMYQNATLPLMLPTFKTWGGRGAALSAWGKQAAAVYGSLKIAEWFGAETEDDERSPNFGAITLPGGQQINLFRKITDPVRFFAQQTGGSFNSEGGYKEPSFYNNAYHLGKYAMGKASPLGRLAINSATGERFDHRKGESVPFSPLTGDGAMHTISETGTPLSIQQAMESDGDISAIVAAFFGVDIKPKSQAKRKAPDIPWRRKG